MSFPNYDKFEMGLAIYRVVYDETDLPPCAELLVSLHDNPVRRAYDLVIDWPGGYQSLTSISHIELDQLQRPAMQLQVVADHARRMARQWLDTVAQ